MASQRGYSDFANIPCAAPGNYDLTQLRKAIGPNMVPLREMESLLRTLMAFDKLAKA